MPREYCKIAKCQRYANLTSDGICPRHDTLTKKTKGEVVYNCLECTMACTEMQKAILCERCDQWAHITCAEIDEELYDIFFKNGSRLNSFRYFCKRCDDKVIEALEKYATLEHDTQELKTEMVDVKKQLDGINKTIKSSIAANLTNAIDDRKEIEKRKMNLIVFGLAEIDEDGKSWSTNDKVQKDIEVVSNVITNDLGIGLSPRNGIIDARRLGMKNKDGKPRPLKIEFKDIQTKRDVLSSAKKLRTTENPIANKLYINPDLTDKQREIDSKLRAEMWKLRGEGKNVIIRKGAVVTVEYEVRKTRSAPVTTKST